jgi:hypothetical protein
MRFWGLIRKRLQTLFPSYRPERHYMRGPGPKWREQHAPVRIRSRTRRRSNSWVALFGG